MGVSLFSTTPQRRALRRDHKCFVFFLPYVFFFLKCVRIYTYIICIHTNHAHVASLSLARQYLSNQQLPKPPRRHGSLDQRSPLRSSLILQCSRQFNLVRRFCIHIIGVAGVATCHTHELSFSTIRGFNRDNPIVSNSRWFSHAKDCMYRGN